MCTATVARLISVVEIVKRQLPKAARAEMELKVDDKTYTTRLELHQYNEVGCLEDLPEYAVQPETQETRHDRIRHSLQGKTQYVGRAIFLVKPD